MNLALAMFGEKPRVKTLLGRFSPSPDVDRQLEGLLICY